MKTQTYRTTRVTTVATGTPLTAPAPRKTARTAASVKPLPAPAPIKGMFEILGQGKLVLVDAMVPADLARAMQSLFDGWHS